MIGATAFRLLRWARDRAEDWADYLDLWVDILDPEYLDELSLPEQR